MHCEYNSYQFLFHGQIYCWAPSGLSVITPTQRSVSRPLAGTVTVLRRKLHLDSLWHFPQGTFTICGLWWSNRHCLLWLWLAQPLQRLMVYLVCWEEACFWQSDCFTVRVCVLIVPHFLSTLGWPKQKQTDGTVKTNTSAVHMSYSRGLFMLRDPAKADLRNVKIVLLMENNVQVLMLDT